MIFKVLLCIIGFFFFFTVLLVFGDSPSFRNTPIHKVRIYFLNATTKLYSVYRYLDVATQGRLVYYLGWGVPVGYLIVVGICFQQFIQKTLPMLSIGYFNHVYILFSMFAVFATTIACCMISPGEVIETSAKLARFQPDQLIFFKNNYCKTCQLIKPARSKHCSICNHCYLLYDHHCIWVNNCIGFNNYKWFVMFLFANINMLAYGWILCFSVISLQMQNWQSFWSVVTRTNDANKVTGIFVILCSIFVVIATLFTSLHVRYVYLGVTTNELDKWSEIEHLVDIGVLYKVSPPIEEETFVEKGFLTGEPVYISLKDERILNVDEVSLVPVESVVSDINNIYDKGFWENLRERLQI